MFDNNERVKHFKFGEGTVINFDINDDILNSIVNIKFDSGETKKIALKAFGPNNYGKVFIVCEDSEVRPFVDSLLEEEKEKKVQLLKSRKLNKKIDLSKVYKYDEHERVVTKEDWEKCYKLAETYRFFHESRAVVMDDEMVFINAACGLRYCEADPRNGDKVYERCEGIYRSKYAGAKWRYAKKDEIKQILDNWKEETEDDTK